MITTQCENCGSVVITEENDLFKLPLLICPSCEQQEVLHWIPT